MAEAKKKKQQQSAPTKQPQQAVNKRHAKAVDKPKLLNYYIALFVILVAAFVAYLPAIHNGFVWDDEYYILNNASIHTINLKELFTQYIMGNYHPLTMLSYSIEYHFWGLWEKGYHITNILIHLANIVLVFYAVLLLSNKPEVALVVALLFGVHPMHVESVAWVAERKDLLYTFFFLASYVCYLKYLNERTTKLYIFCLLLFLLSLLSKAMAASLPAVLLLTDYFKEGKINARAWLNKIPFIILAVILGVVAVSAQKSHNAVVDMTSYTLVPRIVFACYGFVTYILKLLLPFDLSAYYPYPVKGGNTVTALYYIYPVLVLILLAFVFYSLRSSRKILFGVGFFAITVFLVLQLLPVGDAVMADRYSYIPSIGLFYLIGEGFYWLWNKKGSAGGKFRVPAASLLIVIAALLAFQTSARCAVWKDGMSLWNDVISHYQTIPSAYSNRGKLLLEEKKYEEALSDFNKAVELDPNFAQVYNNRGALLMDLNRYEESKKDFDRAVALQPQFAFAYNNRGMLMHKMENDSAALYDYNKAIEMKPEFTEAYFNRGIIFENFKQHDEALNDYNKVVALNPNYILVYNNRGNILMNAKRYDEALSDYNKTIELNPNSPNAYLNMGTLYTYEQKYEDAIANYTKALELAPDFGQGYYNRAIVENTMGKNEPCCADLQKAISLKYTPAENAYNLFCH